MHLPIELDEIIQKIIIQFDEHSSYLNKKTGEMFTIGMEEMAAAEEELPLEDFPL